MGARLQKKFNNFWIIVDLKKNRWSDGGNRQGETAETRGPEH